MHNAIGAWNKLHQAEEQFKEAIDACTTDERAEACKRMGIDCPDNKPTFHELGA